MKPELFLKTQRLHADGAEALDAGAGAEDSESQVAKARRRRIVLLSAGILAVSGAGIYAATHMGAPAPVQQTQAGSAQPVTVAEVVSREFHPSISVTGEARPKHDIHVFASASGVRVLQLMADAGDQVRKGQPLARLDSALANAQIQAAQANVASAQSAAIRARDEYNRAESIRDSGALSDEQIGQRRAAAAAADAQLSAARAQSAEVNARMQGGYVRAPESGLVISRTVELGAMVDQQEMFRIAGGNALEVSSQIPESQVLTLRVGQPAIFHLVDGTTETGRLSRNAASIDSRTRTGEALFDLPSRSRVRAGMFLRGDAQLPARTALSAPQAAVLFDNGQAFVYVIDGQNRARKTAVRTGLREGDEVEMVSGLQQGVRIVGSGAAFVQDGDLVQPISTAAEPPAGQRSENVLRGFSDDAG